MKWQIFIFISVMALAATGPFCYSAHAQEGGSAVLDEEGYQAITEDIEIMRRVLDKTLGSHLRDQKADVSKTFADPPPESSDKSAVAEYYYGLAKGLASTSYLNDLYCRSGASTEGLYVPGSGAIFSLDVTVRAREITQNVKEQPPSDLWEETKRELQEGRDLKSLKKEKEKKWVLDSNAVDEIIDLLVRTVAIHGRNIEHLRGSDRITLLVDFQGKTELQQVSKLTGDTSLALASYLTVSGTASLKEHVIIQVPVSSLDGFHDVEDLGHVKRSTLIARYPGKGRSTRLNSYFFNR